MIEVISAIGYGVNIEIKKRYRKVIEETLIYVLGSARGPKKIGLANSPISRMKTLQAGHPHKLSVLYARSVAKSLSSDIERRVFWLLRDRKVRGELFRVSLTEARAAIDQAVLDDGRGEKDRSVGRPPLKTSSVTKPTMVRLTDDVRQRIEAIAGPNKMAEFIREAIEGELKKREQRTPKR